MFTRNFNVNAFLEGEMSSPCADTLEIAFIFYLITRFKKTFKYINNHQHINIVVVNRLKVFCKNNKN